MRAWHMYVHSVAPNLFADLVWLCPNVETKKGHKTPQNRKAPYSSHADPRQVGHSFVDQTRRLQRQGELRLRSHGRLQSQGRVH